MKASETPWCTHPLMQNLANFKTSYFYMLKQEYKSLNHTFIKCCPALSLNDIKKQSEDY